MWVADSTPVECGRSRDTARRSALPAGPPTALAAPTPATWGLRLHLICALHGRPVAFALANPKADQREVLVELLDVQPGLVAARPGWSSWPTRATAMPRRGNPGRSGRAGPAADRQGRGTTARPRAVQAVAAAHRVGQRHPQGQLDLERHGGPTIEGVSVRVLQRLLALTAAIWHNHQTGQPVLRSLVAYDHS